MTADDRRGAHRPAALYLSCDVAQVGRVPIDCADVLQPGDKHAPPAELLAAARLARRRSAEHGVLGIVNDDPRLGVEAAADGVRPGQDDGFDQASARRRIEAETGADDDLRLLPGSVERVSECAGSRG